MCRLMLKRWDMSKPNKKKEKLEVIQVSKEVHGAIKATAALHNILMPNAATQLINIALAMNPDLERG